MVFDSKRFSTAEMFLKASFPSNNVSLPRTRLHVHLISLDFTKAFDSVRH